MLPSWAADATRWEVPAGKVGAHWRLRILCCAAAQPPYSVAQPLYSAAQPQPSVAQAHFFSCAAVGGFHPSEARAVGAGGVILIL
jgi:hypothetical protein